MFCWKGDFGCAQGCKIFFIFACEGLDLIFEIAIVAVFSQLQNEYTDYRARAGDAAKIANLVQAPENTVSFVFFCIFAGVSMIVDIAEIVYLCCELKSDKTLPVAEATKEAMPIGGNVEV